MPCLGAFIFGLLFLAACAVQSQGTSCAAETMGMSMLQTPSQRLAKTSAEGPDDDSRQRYLISTFPTIKTVAYTILPDNVWRPLYVGKVSNPEGVAVDAQHARLFVADTDDKKIYVYNLLIEDNGLLKTDGQQHVAVNDVTAHWLAVNGLGDLYFSGEKVVKDKASAYTAVYRMDNMKITTGIVDTPLEVYGRSTSEIPPKAEMPSGIAVDSFNVYWGNSQKGKTIGAVCSGTRKNIDAAKNDIKIYSKAVDEVRGMALTGDTIFYLTLDGVYGIPKDEADENKDASFGLIQGPPNSKGWDPKSIAFDLEGTMYYTEYKAGRIYQFPSHNPNRQPHNVYVDAPEVFGVAIFQQTGTHRQNLREVPNYGSRYLRALSESDHRYSAEADESGARAAFQAGFWLLALTALASASAF